MVKSLKKGLRRRLRRAHEPLKSPWQRSLAYFDLMVFDLGLFRLWRGNRHSVAPGVIRSAQPSPGQLKRARRQGVRTVVNLRGADNGGAYALERRACERLGLKLVDFRLKSREIPSAKTLADFSEILRNAEKPLLIHCKSGADRAGLASAAYLMTVEGHSATHALRQLHWRYGHIRHGPPGILTTFLESYRDDGEPAGLDLVEWRRAHCDETAITRRFRTRPLARFLTDILLRRE